MAETAAIDTGGSFGEGGSQIRLPKQSMKGEYMMSCLLVIRDMDAIIKDLKRLDDPRPRVIARQIINRILDDAIKYKLLDAFDARIKEITESKDAIDVKNMAILNASQDAVGEVNSYLDEFFALHLGQEIGDV